MGGLQGVGKWQEVGAGKLENQAERGGGLERRRGLLVGGSKRNQKGLGSREGEGEESARKVNWKMQGTPKWQVGKGSRKCTDCTRNVWPLT